MREGVAVLLIDDDPDYLNLATRYVQSDASNTTLITTEQPEEGLEILEAEDIDCVVCDYEMPDLSGLEVLQEVRAHDEDLPFIFLTGEGSEEVASEAISAGVTDYLLKGGPSQFDRALERIHESVAEYRREQFIEQANEQPVNVIERVTDAFFALDSEWRFTYLNSAAEELLDAPAEELIGQRIWDRFPEAMETQFYEEYHQALEEGEPRSFHARYDPWDRWFAEHVYPSEEGLSIIAHDITEQKKQEEALRHQRDQLDEFASIVSHDLRNPLNVAMGRLELVANECNSEHVEDIDDALDRMRAIIEDLLALAREGEMVTQIAPIDVLEVVEDAWAGVETGNAELRLESELNLYADETQLTRLFENLFHNAIEHGGEEVTVRVGKLEDGHGFYVADDGPGIPPADREAILDRGYSGDEDGTGLGLSIVKRITEAHDWSIGVDESDAGGARLEIRF